MEYGLRYCFLYRAKMRGRFLYEVVIEEKGYKGEAEVLKPCGNVLTIRQGVQDDSPFAPIKGSEATIEILCTDDMRYLSLFTVDARRFRVSVYEYRPDASGRETPILIWRGFLDANSYSEKFARPPYVVTLKATDGLTALGNYPFRDDASERLEGLKSARELLDMCLAQLGLELPVSEWIGVKHASGDADTLSTVYYDCADIYYDNPEATWCDILKLCLPYGAQIFQASGSIHIRRTASLRFCMRPESYSGSHALQGISRTSTMTLWENGCDISSEAELKVLPPLNRIEIKGSGTKKNLAEFFGVYDLRNWDLYYTGRGCSFGDCIQLELRPASALRSLTFGNRLQQAKASAFTVKFEVSNLTTKECPLSFGIFITDHDRRISIWDRTNREWVDLTVYDMNVSNYEKYMLPITIGASERENLNIKRRADKARFASENIDFTLDSIPYDGYLSVCFESNVSIQYLQISNIEITASGEVEDIIETERNVIINRDHLEKLSVDTCSQEGGYIPNIDLYLNNVIRTATGTPSTYLISQYGGSEHFGVIEADARALRDNVAYAITGEFRSRRPIDINTLLFDRKYTGRLYYINYLERIVARDLYKAQLYQLMDASRHPEWTGTYKSLIDRNEFDIQELFTVDGTLFFSEKHSLWRMDFSGTPQNILSTSSDLYVYQGNGCIVAAVEGDEPSVMSYDATGFQTAKIANPSESLGVLPTDRITRDATSGIWYASHFEKGILTITIFRDNGCIVDTRTFECEEVRNVLFAPNSFVAVTDRTSYMHNFSLHGDGELPEVEYWNSPCWIIGVSGVGTVFHTSSGTRISSRVGMGLRLSGGIGVPYSPITALSDRFAAAYGAGDLVYVYDFYNGVLSEIPAPAGRNIARIAIIGSMLYLLADNGIMQYYILDDTVLGEGNQYNYILEPIMNTTSIGAAGGAVEIAALLKVIDESGKLISSERITPTITGWAEGFKIEGNTVSAENRTTTVGPERELILTLTHPFVRNGIRQTVTAQAAIRQAANRIERLSVAAPEIVSGKLPIPAAGGTVRMAFPLSGTFTSGSTGVLDLYPDTITGSSLNTWLRVDKVNIDGKGAGLELSATGLGTTESPEKRTTVNMRMTKRDEQGMLYTIDYAVGVEQSANCLEGYGVPTLVPETISIGDVPASGGTAGALRFTGAQAATYTSGSSLPVTFNQDTSGIVITYGTRVRGDGLGTTVRGRTKLGDQRFTVHLHDRTSAEYAAPVYQQANSLDGLTFVSSAWESGTWPISAAGGSAVFFYKLRASYTSGAAVEVYPESVSLDRLDDMPAGYAVAPVAVSGKGTGLKCTAPALGTDVTAAWSYTFDATYRYGGRSVLQKGLTTQQQANLIASFTNDGWTVPMTVPASGGSVSGQLLATFTYTSKASEQVRITEYASLPVSDGVLSWRSVGGRVELSAPSRNVTVVNEHKVSREITYRYKGTEYTYTSSYSQAPNYIVRLDPTATFEYDPITAAATSARSRGNIAVTLVFSSGATFHASGPMTNAAGTLSAERRFTLSDIRNGFTAVDTATGILTATNRGSAIGAARTSAPVYLNAKFTFAHSETFAGGGTVTGTASATATCTQQANLAVSVRSDSSFHYAGIGAGATAATPTLTGSCVLTLASGATLTVGTVASAPAGTTMSAASAYKLLEVKNGFTAVNASTGTLTATSRGTTAGDARTSGTVTRLLSWTLQHDASMFSGEGYNLLRNTRNFTGWGKISKIADETYNGLTVCYAKSVETYMEICEQASVTFSPSTEYTLSFWAKGSGQVISYCWPYVNEEILATNGTAVGYQGRDTYCPFDLTSEWKRCWVTFRTYNEAKAGAVLFRVMAGNEAYVCGAQLMKGAQQAPYQPSPLDAVLSTGTAAETTCTQAANRIESYGTPTLVPETISIGDVPASGGTAGTIRFSGAQTVIYSSGGSLPVTFTEATAGVVVSLSLATPVSGGNLGTTLKARTLLGTLKFTVSHHDRTSAEYAAPVYQQANELVSVKYITGATLSGPSNLRSYPAAGGTTEMYMQLSAAYTSGSTRLVKPSAANPRPAVRWITAQRFEHATYGDCVRFVVAANTTGAARTGTVSVTLAYDEGGKTVSTVMDISVTQLAQSSGGMEN